MFARSRGLVEMVLGQQHHPGGMGWDGMRWEDRGREGCLGKGRFPSRVRGCCLHSVSCSLPCLHALNKMQKYNKINEKRHLALGR